MSDETRDIAIESRNEIKNVKELIKQHISETREYRSEVYARIDKIEAKVGEHHDLFEQGKGAWKAAAAIGAIVSAIVASGLALLAKIAGFIRIA